MADAMSGIETGEHEAVGYSIAWDVGAAFREAVGRLEATDPADRPDHLARYEIVAIGAEVGGIAGFNRLWVKARGR